MTQREKEMVRAVERVEKGDPIKYARQRAGHPRFYELTRAEEELHERKNGDYAGGGDPCGNFDRVAAILSLYPNFPYNTNYGVAMIYALKQWDAAMWLMATGREGDVEGVPERLGDDSVYKKLARLMYEERNEKSEEKRKEKREGCENQFCDAWGSCDCHPKESKEVDSSERSAFGRPAWTVPLGEL